MDEPGEVWSGWNISVFCLGFLLSPLAKLSFWSVNIVWGFFVILLRWGTRFTHGCKPCNPKTNWAQTWLETLVILFGMKWPFDACGNHPPLLQEYKVTSNQKSSLCFWFQVIHFRARKRIAIWNCCCERILLRFFSMERVNFYHPLSKCIYPTRGYQESERTACVLHHFTRCVGFQLFIRHLGFQSELTNQKRLGKNGEFVFARRWFLS